MPLPHDLQSVGSIQKAIEILKQNKPKDRSDKDRAYAVTLTKLEEAYAYFITYVIMQASDELPKEQ